MIFHFSFDLYTDSILKQFKKLKNINIFFPLFIVLCCFPFCFPVVLPYCIPRCTTPSLGRSPGANRWKNDDLGLVPIFKNKYFKKICNFFFSDRYAQILTCHYVTKAAFSSFQTIKVTFLILHHFPVIVLPLCFPVVTSRCASPGRWSQCNESFSANARAALNARARVGGKAGSRTSTQRRGSATGNTIGKHNGETKRETTEKNEKWKKKAPLIVPQDALRSIL